MNTRVKQLIPCGVAVLRYCYAYAAAAAAAAAAVQSRRGDLRALPVV